MAGGFVRDTVYVLNFDDAQYEGLIVKARSAPVGRLVELAALVDKVNATESLDELLSGFAKSLISWNLETPDGEPVPATLESLREQDFEFVIDIVMAWMDAVASVAGPLGKRLAAGKASAAVSIPMEPLSPSRAS